MPAWGAGRGLGGPHLPQVAAQNPPFTIQLAWHLPNLRCSSQVKRSSGTASVQGGGERGGGGGGELEPAGISQRETDTKG